MHMLLTPPIIESTIPACYKNKNGTVKITVPFFLDGTIDTDRIISFNLKIKTIYSSTYLLALNTKKYDFFNNQATFILNTEQAKLLNIGQFYKIQLAYVCTYNGNVQKVSVYSDVGVIKYTSKPKISLLNLNTNIINLHNQKYIGIYNQNGATQDISEKEYSYQFYIENNKNEIIFDTGEIIHNNYNDNTYDVSEDVILCPINLINNQIYYITYKVTTMNGLIIKTPHYRVVQRDVIPFGADLQIKPKLNYDNGYIEISFINNEKDKKLVGSFVLSRSSEDAEYNNWVEIAKFNLSTQNLNSQIIKDFTIEQGKNYKYSLQKYNDNNIYSSRLISEPIYADFEDAFLFDGKRQLRIRYNPKIASFKATHLEQKIDTIGSKYPFIVKNGNTNYKEFSISGLISYYSDNESLFINEIQLNFNKEIENLERTTGLIKSSNNQPLYSTQIEKNKQIMKKRKDIISNNYKKRTTDFESYNIYSERIFKLEVLKWLSNGQPKLFRSPCEGNYLVNLMNVSLSPNDTVGRMLHTFQATAYEIGEQTYENLVKKNIIKIKGETKKMLFSTIPLSVSKDPHNGIIYNKFNKDSNSIIKQPILYASGELIQTPITINSIQITDMAPGDILIINGQKIVIGITGQYNLNTSIYSIIIPDNCYYNGLITYSYYGLVRNDFNGIKNVSIKEKISHQFIGDHKDILKTLSNIKTKLLNVYCLQAVKRPIEEKMSYDDYRRQEHTLALYRMKAPNSSNILTLYHKVRFIDERDENININNTSPHGPLKDKYTLLVKDFKRYLQEQELYTYKKMNNNWNFQVVNKTEEYNNNIVYWIKEPVYIYKDLYNLSKTYIDLMTFNDFKIMINYIESKKGQTYLLDRVLEAYDIYSTDIYINNEKININTDKYILYNLDKNCEINISSGVYLELTYSLATIDYEIEEKIPELRDQKNNLDLFESRMNSLKYAQSETEIESIINKESIKEYQKNYIDYLQNLKNNLQEYGEEGGLFNESFT